MQSLRNRLLSNKIVYHKTIERLSSTMKSWQIKQLGDNVEESLSLRSDSDMPVIHKPNDVLVHVLASSVNPIDVQMSCGYAHTAMFAVNMITDCGIDRFTYDRLPLTVGRDFSGVVVDRGLNARDVDIGDHVFGCVPPYINGSHSQFIVADQCYMCQKPRNLSHTLSASLPYAALTAWSAICSFGSINERNASAKRTLVLGGSGGVGTIAIQLLKHWGSHVITTCSTDAVEFIRSNIEVDHCIAYDSNELISSYGPFDFILNATTGTQQQNQNESLIKHLRKWSGAKYVTLSPPLLRNTDSYGLLFGTALSVIDATKQTINSVTQGTSARWAFFCPNSNALKSISHLAENGKIKPIVNEIFSFDDIPKAYLKAMSGHARGKIVIDFTERY